MHEAGRVNIIGQNILDAIRRWTEVTIKYWENLFTETNQKLNLFWQQYLCS